MVRRVIGASAAPTPDFSPFRAVTPAGGLTDFYRQPGTMAIPESEFSQVAQALQSISPTLSKVIGDTTEAANQAQADQGRMDAEKLTAEQKRDAMRGEFTLMEMSGAIPKGASPFRLAAMQAALGKQAVQNELRIKLNENIARFSDPYSQEDPAKFVQQEFAKITEGMEFYARGAATEALDQVESTFLNRASLMKAENRAQQNKKDLTSNLFNEFISPVPEGISQANAVEASRGRLQELVDTHFKDTGESGRESFMIALRAAAMSYARKGDADRAEDLIAAARGVVIGSAKIIDSEATAFNDLSADVSERAERENEEEDQRRSRERSERSSIAREVSFLMRSRFKTAADEQKQNLDDPQFIETIKQELKERGLEGESQEAALGEVRAALRSAKKSLPIDQATISRLYTAISQSGTSAEQNRATIVAVADQLPPEVLTNLLRQVDRKSNRESNFNSLTNQTSSFERIALQSIERSLNNARMDTQVEAVTTEFILQARQIRNEIVGKVEAGSLAPEQMFDEFQKAFKVLKSAFENDISQGTNKELRDDTDPVIRKAIEDTRLEDAKESIELAPGEEPATPEALRARTDAFVIDSYATINLETLQNKDASLQDKNKAKKTVYADSLQALDDIRKEAQRPRVVSRGFGTRMGAIAETVTRVEGVPDNLKRQEILLRAVAGFTLDEIKNKKTSLGTDIPEALLNPKHVILFPGIQSHAEFMAFRNDPANHAAILEVMKSVPAEFRYGTDQEDITRFLKAQNALMLRYRAGGQ